MHVKEGVRVAMYAEERRTALIELARVEGRVTVSESAQQFAVTPETIRRDLEVLDRKGILRRVHGGAVLTDSLWLGDLSIVDRDGTASEEKHRIATAALAYLPESGAAIIIDAGTTTERLARVLPADYVIVTNSLPAAQAASSARPGADVRIVGGRVRGITQSVVGGAAEFARLRCEVAFLGANGLSQAHGLSTPDLDEAEMKRAMVNAANRVVVLLDSRKLGVETTTSFAQLTDIDVVITDDGITDTQQRRLTELGIEVVVA